MTVPEENVAVLIGATRGIGLAISQVLKDQGYTVLAGVRHTSEELSAVGVSVVEGVDIAQDDGCKPLLQALGSRQISLLIVNAGIQEIDNLDSVTRDSVRRQFEVNALGPLFAVQALRSKLSKGAKVALISSRNASIQQVDFTGGEMYGYRMSKVALNMAGVVLARDLKATENPVALIHPGVVNTQMLRSLREARGVAPEKLTLNTITPEASAAGILSLIKQLNLENTGNWWAADKGDAVPW